jgi:hypothetical protein
MRIRLAALLALILCLPLFAPPARSAPAPVRVPFVRNIQMVPANLQITELVYSGNDEYVAIKNTGAIAINLSGYRLQSLVGDQWYAFGEHTLAPDATIRIHSGPAATANPPSDLLWTRSYIWNNGGDKARLYDPSGRLIASRGY